MKIVLYGKSGLIYVEKLSSPNQKTDTIDNSWSQCT